MKALLFVDLMQSDSTATSSVYAGRVYLIWINLSVLGYRILLKADEFYKAHNILLRSMNRRPSAEMNWGEYFLGVYPLSLQFSRDYNTKFQLYFEKSLQIISRYETPTSVIKKQEPVVFNNPAQIQHFKIQSDKNLDFRWSLYIKREDIIGNNQEFIEGQKIAITDMLNAYLQTGQNSFQCSITFNRMKSKFTYLFCISNSPKDLLNNVQKHNNQHKPSVLTSDSRLVAPSTSEMSSLKEDTKVQKNSSLNHGDSNSEYQAKIEPSQVRDEPSYRFHNAKDKRKIEEVVSQEWLTDKKIKSEVQGLSPGSDVKLSNSDIQIGNEIEEKINASQKEVKKLSFGSSSKLSSSEKNEKVIKLTSSQLLNEHGEVIVPFYRKKLFYVLIAVVILFLASRVFRGSDGSEKEKPKKGKEARKPKDSKRQNKKETPKPKKRKV